MSEEKRLPIEKIIDSVRCMDTDEIRLLANDFANTVRIAKDELVNRGLDINGKWVGFQEAKKLHSATAEKEDLATVKQLKMEAEDAAAEIGQLKNLVGKLERAAAAKS